MTRLHYTTPHGITVTRSASKVPYARGLGWLLKQLDRKRGAYLSSGYEYPERYSRWDVAAVSPPIEIIGRGRKIEIHALNRRGKALVALLGDLLRHHPHWRLFEQTEGLLTGELKPLADRFPEEERSKQPSAFSILRTLIEEFRHPDDSRLALLGAFGYDLLLQFDPIRLRLAARITKGSSLFLCDDIYFMDRKKEVIERFRYDFSGQAGSTVGLPRTSGRIKRAKSSAQPAEIVSDHTPEEYMEKVEVVREGMRAGRLLRSGAATDVSARPTLRGPSELFQRIQKASPSPYEFILQMGDEQLIGASPEMFVRVEGERVETCPIAGTARRSGDPLRDAESIRRIAQLDQRRVGADDVQRRRPQRQVARLCSWFSARDRATVDRVICRPLSYRRSRERHLAGRVSIPSMLSYAHVGRNDHWRSEKGCRSGDRRS